MEKMDDGVNGGGRRRNVFVFAYPKQGHISPMLQFSKRLVSKGLFVTFLTTSSSSSQSINFDLSPSSSLNLHFISDVSETVVTNLESFYRSFEAAVSKSFLDFFTGSENYTEGFLVYDSVMPWILDLAKDLGLEAAPFFTQSSAVNHILYHVYQGSLKIPPVNDSAISLPSMPILQIEDLPSFPFNDETKSVVNFMTSQFSSFHQPNWIFCNTFHHLEPQVLTWMADRWPIKAVGPTIPSAYLDGRLEDDKSYGLKNPNDAGAIEWLDSREVSSVIYISFGSLAILQEEQVHELTSCLRDNINFSFLWVLKESEVEKLPDDFVQETSDRGLVVSWCPQLEVLPHKAISCFVTHCGWNSTLEALSLGVPMVAIPQWVDQTTNAKFVADVWEVGVRVKLNDKSIATKEEIQASVEKVVQGERRDEFKQNSIKWKNLAKQAVDEGGSSDKNIEEFVKTIASI